MIGVLSRQRIVARPGFNRWWILPATLAIELSIGQIYAFSVFSLPLTRAIGITDPAPADWKLTTLGWTFTLAMVCLGLSAALGGRWVERVGPRHAGVVAALCWGSGFLIAAAGVHLHVIWLLYLGYGVLGGCGLGLGYITPVTTLIQWFPDRRGLATGLAIMGFGGGAMLAAPVSEALMHRFATPTSVGVAETFVVLGLSYAAIMLTGAFLFRVPPPGWKPAGLREDPADAAAAARPPSVSIAEATRTPQFVLLWCVLFLNVTAGIGVLSQASAMVQEVFDGFSAAAAAVFVGLLGLFNMAGRLFWASFSDRIGRRATFALFFTVGPILYLIVPWSHHVGGLVLFVGCFAVIMTMYGGGFSTMPAYLADIFGTHYVSALLGRILTAHSAAAVAGPVLVSYLREFQIESGVPKGQAYNMIMYIMAALLIAGFLCNRAIIPVQARRPPALPVPEKRERGEPAAIPEASAAPAPARSMASDGQIAPEHGSQARP